MTRGINDTTSVKKIMGLRLRAAREAKGLTRQSFTDTINNNEKRPINNNEPEEMTVERLKQWEYGNNPISLEWIPLICETLSCDVGYLFGDYQQLCRVSADVAKETGLSEGSIQKLQELKTQNPEYSNVVSALIEDFNFEYLVYLILKRFTYSLTSNNVKPLIEEKDGEVHIKNANQFHEAIKQREIAINLDGATLLAQKQTLLDSMITSAMIDRMKNMAESYCNIERGGHIGTKK